jgi:hypothetical protein
MSVKSWWQLLSVLLSVSLSLLAQGAIAIEARDARGLQVTIERIGEPVIVNGVELRIQRAQGIDIAQLASRIEQRWRTEGGELRHLHLQGWQMLGRWQDGRSDLIQWRGEGSDALLLYSRLDTLQQPQRRSAPPFSLPSGCAWGRVVEGESMGRQYLQRSAVCRASSAAAQPAVRAVLQAQGWTLRGETAATMELAQRDVQGTLVFARGRNLHETALVWIGVSSMAGKPQ